MDTMDNPVQPIHRKTVMKERVIINEVGLRDGLQNQPRHATTEQKARLAQALVDAGIRYLEPVSFVHPKAVPQMADAAELTPLLPQNSELQYTALVPNLKGYERAKSFGYRWVASVLSSTDTFNQRNLNMDLATAKQVNIDIINQAKQDGIHVRAYISGAFACPYDGKTPVDVTIGLARDMIAAGADEISIADTIGAGNPQQMKDIMTPLIEDYGADIFNVHLHDTRGQGLAMAWAAADLGVRRFDSSIGGLGGCPFAPGASGNIATEDLVYMLEECGFDTGISMEGLRAAVAIAEDITEQSLGGRILQWIRSQEIRQCQS